MTYTVMVLCSFCGGISQLAPEDVNTKEPCAKCIGRNPGHKK